MKIGILTGGGDCPGMNAFIRSVVRSAINQIPDVEVWGILDGWRGLLEQSYRQLGIMDTAGINTLGGTILGTVRVPELQSNLQWQRQVADNFIAAGFDALLICGGNGSLRAANALDCLLRERIHRGPSW